MNLLADKKTTRHMVISGLLIALSIVLTRIFGINMPMPGYPGVTGFRITIGAVPIILAGMALGPLWGFFVGAIADYLGFFIVYGGFPNPFITLVSALTGLLPWVCMKILLRLGYKWKLLISVSVTQIMCALLLQSGSLAILYAVTMNLPFAQAFSALAAYRAPFVLASIPVFHVLLYYTVVGLNKAKLLSID